MKRSIVKLSAHGHDDVAEWDTETVTPARLKEIEKEFKALMKQGYTPADVTDKIRLFICAAFRFKLSSSTTIF